MNRRLVALLIIASSLALIFIADRFYQRHNSANIEPRLPVHMKSEGRNDREKENVSPQAVLPPLDNYKSIWTRPVFKPSRRPKVIAVATKKEVTKTKTDNPPNFKVIGVATSPLGSTALIRTADNVAKRYYISSSIDGWTIEVIEPQWVTVTNGQKHIQMAVGEIN